ncbi:MAG TPA: class I SAM-dependent methyltransferase [Nitrospiraceae bacterium]|jgi:SAM-dependent methyltransferase|nr:class I SAM-dependent methyltransferase [Nitrospiraceae bacterium]
MRALRAGTDGLGLLRCAECGLLSRVDRPSESQVRTQYQHEYWPRFSDEQTGSARQNVHVHVMDWLEQLHPERGVLIDVGCGAGALLELCRERRWKGIGFDLSPHAIEVARAQGLDASIQGWPPSPLPDASADAVTFINVLDHLVSPFGALREAWRVLRPGGLLYVRVPNAPVHLRVRGLLGAFGLGRLPVFHLFGFGRSSLRHHVLHAGFQICSLRTAPPSQDFPYTVGGRWRSLSVRLLKVSDRLVYRGMARCGLDRHAWGLSIEVMARRPQSE